MKTGTQMLFETPPLVVNPELATILGINEALILQQIKYWMGINQQQQRNYYQERFWVYNTIDQWHQMFPFMSESTIKRALKRLRESGIIIVSKFNSYPGDQTRWYTIDCDALDAFCVSQQEDETKDLQNSSGIPVGHFEPVQNDPIHWVKMTQSYTKTTTETNSILVALKNNKSFIDLFNEFCPSDKHRTRERTLVRIIDVADRNNSPIDDVMLGMEICIKKDRPGDIKYLNGILMNKSRDRARGIIAPGKPHYFAIVDHLRQHLAPHVRDGYIGNYDIDVNSSVLNYSLGKNAEPGETFTDLMILVCEDLRRAMQVTLTPRLRL